MPHGVRMQGVVGKARRAPKPVIPAKAGIQSPTAADAGESLPFSQYLREIRRKFRVNRDCISAHGGLQWTQGALPEAGGRVLRRQTRSRCRSGRVR